VPDIWEEHECLLGTFYCAPFVYINVPRGLKDLLGLILRATGIEKGQYQRVGFFRLYDLNDMLSRAEQEERSKMTEDLYEAYDEETDSHTFTII